MERKKRLKRKVQRGGELRIVGPCLIKFSRAVVAYVEYGKSPKISRSDIDGAPPRQA